MTNYSTQNDTLAESLPRIEADELEIIKGSVRVLESATLTIRSGVFAAVVGPSGSGKTSLLRALASLDPPASGDIKYSLPNVAERNSSSQNGLYPYLTYIPQTMSLWPHMTFRQNLLFATDQSEKVNHHMHALCDTLQLSPIIDRKPHNASQGQRQRFAIVRALLLHPTVLLCDEVTSALDEDLATTVWSMLKDFVSGGGAILASTHDARLVSQCDEVYSIAHRKLIQKEAGK